MICANDISQSGLGFNSDNNQILMLSSNGNQVQLPAGCKSQIARSILNQINKEFLLEK